MKIRKFCFVASVSLSILAASTSVWASGWGGSSVTLTGVAPLPVWSFVEIYGTGINGSQCPDQTRARISYGNPQFNSLYAAAMAAFLGGRPVMIYVDSCTTDGIGMINGIQVK